MSANRPAIVGIVDLIFIEIVIGLAGAWATIALAQGKRKAYRNALIVLIIVLVLAAVSNLMYLMLFSQPHR